MSVSGGLGIVLLTWTCKKGRNFVQYYAVRLYQGGNRTNETDVLWTYFERCGQEADRKHKKNRIRRLAG